MDAQRILFNESKWHENESSVGALRKGESDGGRYDLDNNTGVYFRLKNTCRRKTHGERKDPRLHSCLQIHITMFLFTQYISRVLELDIHGIYTSTG